MTLKSWLPFFVLFLIVSVSYHNAIEAEFIWDDEFLIEKNTYLRDFRHLPKMLVSNSTAGFGGKDNFYRPTQNIYYLFIFQAFGYNKVAFHIGNILLHLLNSFLFFLLAIRLTRNQFASLIGASLWATHPTHVEAVTYISGTADPFSMLFCLLCLYFFPVSKIKDNLRNYILSILFFILALLSKEAIIIIPGLVCLVLFHLTEPPKLQWRKYLSTLPFWLVASLYMFLRKSVLNFDQTYEFYKESNIYTENLPYRLYTFLATLPEYILILFRPIELHMERRFPVFTGATHGPVVIGAALLLLSLGLCLFLYLKKQKTLPLFCWLWFFGSFLPMTGILVPVNSFLLEHWLYVPSFGVFIVLGVLIEKSSGLHKKAPWILTGALVLSLSALTVHRNKDWRTPISFYSNILKYNDGTARIHNNLAMAYSAEKSWSLAIEHYLKAISISDTYPQTHYNLARAYIQINQPQKALQHLNQSLKLKPDFTYALKLKQDLTNFLKNKRNQ